MVRLLIISVMFISCSAFSTHEDVVSGVNYNLVKLDNNSDSTLNGIQKKIKNVFNTSMAVRNDNKLNELSDTLDELYKSTNQNIIGYWSAYLKFYMSIYYNVNENKKMAEKIIDKGIDIMKTMKSKNSEDYALLSMLQGYGIQFKGFRAMFIAGKIKENANIAIKLDSTNLRGYYVYGSNDFYTPEKYGGGKEAEKYLLKALSLKENNINNDMLPTWGKEETYELLIRLYIKQNKIDLAKKYFNEGVEKFPYSYTINKLRDKIFKNNKQ